MNRNAIVGLIFVIAAGALACVCASARICLATDLLGKAVWYLPYVSLVVGVRVLVRARSNASAL